MENKRYFEYGAAEIETLKKVDPVLGNAIDRIGIIKRELIPDLFEALVNAIVGQMISTKAAKTVWSRLLELVGTIAPQAIYETPVEHIQRCGITMKKAEAIYDIALKVCSGEFEPESLYNMPDAQVIQQLVSLKGVGSWTAEMLLIFSMERPDIVSWKDIGIRRGMCRLYGLGELSRSEFDYYREKYSPYGTVASLYLWELSR